MCECVYFYLYGLVNIIGSFLTGLDRGVKNQEKRKKKRSSFIGGMKKSERVGKERRK